MWHNEDYNIFIVHFIQLAFILLYNGLCMQLFFYSPSLLHSYLYLLLFAHGKNILLYTFMRTFTTYYQPVIQFNMKRTLHPVSRFSVEWEKSEEFLISHLIHVFLLTFVCKVEDLLFSLCQWHVLGCDSVLVVNYVFLHVF